MPRLAALHGREATVVLLAAIASLAARLLMLGVPSSSDEAGFLLVGSQWHPGLSLYGDYWVDRPPGLVAIFAVAAEWHGQVAIRLIGAVCAAGSVLAAGALAGTVAPGRRGARAMTAIVVAALVSSALLDVSMVDGEILALPLVIVGLTALLRAAHPALQGSDNRTAGRASLDGTIWWAFLAGASGAAAVMIKQNFADVFVATAFVAVVVAVRCGARRAALLIGAVGAGVGATVGVLLVLSVARGTSLADLWYATVSFRSQASALIARSATQPTTNRAYRLAGAALASGAPLALAHFWHLSWRRPRDRTGADPTMTWLCLLLVGFEAASIVLGGSYWLHYLVQMIPGVALLTATAFRTAGPLEDAVMSDIATPLVATRSRRRTASRLHWGVAAVVVASSLVTLGLEVAHPRSRTADERAVIDYLRDHARQGRTVVIAFGNAGLIHDSGMTSPYPDLWSLPVRVRDPGLTRLSALLDSPARPQWVVVHDDSLASWGIDATTADQVLAHRYSQAFTTSTYQVMQARS